MIFLTVNLLTPNLLIHCKNQWCILSFHMAFCCFFFSLDQDSHDSHLPSTRGLTEQRAPYKLFHPKALSPDSKIQKNHDTKKLILENKPPRWEGRIMLGHLPHNKNPVTAIWLCSLNLIMWPERNTGTPTAKYNPYPRCYC